MYPQYHKVKSASKQISYGSPLQQKVISTLETIANVVGGTLGPGGKPVLI
jgi:chaperonin GroEL (HSP60 family)